MSMNVFADMDMDNPAEELTKAERVAGNSGVPNLGTERD